ncbi:heat-inducible transcriptional repressor HrcA [Bifidobacterium aquikefiri]|uniref:Heat-inducible transcription repressor HrcA n=1 Tax=Bifidobacterium aquikefiri TaxID=1653207 RepID=A0A261G6F3_9BIFI|nr:heat-inducible transcriptional repressor HrcA [Bifidobacterium aquikefiri]OZG67000.1 HrcA family transcriptional regulator [Bifidobacterium aquikefiri]
MTNTRRMLVLRAVVEDYIRSQEPVGSGSLTKSHDLGVSSATVRNDMSALEDEGFLVQPHTSAGRIPTEKGYRYFVDRLAKIVPLSRAQRRGIDGFLSGSVSLEDTLHRAAQLLAQVTGQVAIVASPSLAKSLLRRIEIVALAPTMLLVVVITDTGSVVQRTLRCSEVPSAELINRLGDVVNQQCQGVSLSRTGEFLRSLSMTAAFHRIHMLVVRLAEIFDDMAGEEQSSKLYMAGTSQLTHQQAIGITDLAPIFDALEEQVVLMRLMSALSEVRQSHGVSVAIGSETHTLGLIHAAVVTSGYGHIARSASADAATGLRRQEVDGADDISNRLAGNAVEMNLGTGDEDESSVSDTAEPVAFIGSIGPTHMDYAATISAVQAVARYLTSCIAQENGNETSPS